MSEGLSSGDMSLRLRRLGGRLVTYAAGRSPLADAGGAGERFASAVRAGRTPAQVMEQTGVAAPLARAVAVAAPSDLPGALEEVATALGRFHARRRAMRGAGAYALLLAFVTSALGALILFQVAPVLTLVVQAERGPTTGLDVSRTPALAALVLAAACLVYLGLALFSRAPLFPFGEACRTQCRALVLAAASAFARHRVPLPVALRAGAELSPWGALRESALEVAAALERGGAGGQGVLLFGGLGAGLFGAAASEGEGTAALEAMADLQETVAQQQMPALLARAELLSLLLAGVALAVAAASFMLAYATSLVRW